MCVGWLLPQGKGVCWLLERKKALSLPVTPSGWLILWLKLIAGQCQVFLTPLGQQNRGESSWNSKTVTVSAKTQSASVDTVDNVHQSKTMWNNQKKSAWSSVPFQRTEGTVASLLCTKNPFKKRSHSSNLVLGWHALCGNLNWVRKRRKTQALRNKTSGSLLSVTGYCDLEKADFCHFRV